MVMKALHRSHTYFHCDSYFILSLRPATQINSFLHAPLSIKCASITRWSILQKILYNLQMSTQACIISINIRKLKVIICTPFHTITIKSRIVLSVDSVMWQYFTYNGVLSHISLTFKFISFSSVRYLKYKN